MFWACDSGCVQAREQERIRGTEAGQGVDVHSHCLNERHGERASFRVLKVERVPADRCASGDSEPRLGGIR